MLKHIDHQNYVRHRRIHLQIVAQPEVDTTVAGAIPEALRVWCDVVALHARIGQRPLQANENRTGTTSDFHDALGDHIVICQELRDFSGFPWRICRIPVGIFLRIIAVEISIERRIRIVHSTTFEMNFPHTMAMLSSGKPLANLCTLVPALMHFNIFPTLPSLGLCHQGQVLLGDMGRRVGVARTTDIVARNIGRIGQESCTGRQASPADGIFAPRKRQARRM